MSRVLIGIKPEDVDHKGFSWSGFVENLFKDGCA